MAHHHPLYSKWSWIQQICDNPNHPHYVYFGARGIENHFASFKEFKQLMAERLGPCPEGHVLGRKDKTDHFYIENMQWETPKTRGRNAPAQNVYATYKRKRKSLAAWAEELSIPYWSLRRRHSQGKPLKDIIKEFQ